MALKVVQDLLLQQLGFNGGLNLRDAVDELSPHEASGILNMVYNDRGAAVSRLGCEVKSSVGSTGNRVLSTHVFVKTGASDRLMIHLSDGTIRWTNNLTSWTTLWSGLSTTARFSFETFNGKVYMANGVDDYRWWDGTTPSTDAAVPKGKFLKLWKDTMMMAGETASILRSSEAANAEVWPTNNFTQIMKDDGDEITGLGLDSDYLVVFKHNKGFVVYDIALLSNRLVDVQKGCESHFSIINHDNAMYYISKQGICRWLGQTPGGLVMSNRIDPIFTAGVVNLDATDSIYAYSHGGRVGWSLPESTFPSFQVELYPRLPELPIAIHRMPVQVFAPWVTAGNESLLGMGNVSNKLFTCFSGPTDDGAAFTSFIETGWHNFDVPNNNKYLRFLRLLGLGVFNCSVKKNYKKDTCKSLPINIPTNVDLWNITETWGSGLWGEGSSGPQWVSLHPDCYGYQFSFRFQGSTAGESVRNVDVGGSSYLQSIGQWGIYHAILHGIKTGDRIPT